MMKRHGILLLLMLGFSLTAPAQVSEPTVYASVFSTKLFVVGAANPQTGMFYHRPSEDTVWRHTGAKNIRANALAVFPGSDGRIRYTASGNGLHKTTDGGNNWKITTGWRITEIWAVSLDPVDPSAVYIGTAYGIYKSTDQGDTWKQVFTGFVSCIIVDRTNPSVLYAATELGVYKSTDRGETWQRTGLSIDRTRTVTQHPKDPQTLLVGTEKHGIYATSNGGRTWTKREAGIDHETFYTIAFDPSDPSIVYAGGYATGVYRSKDGGYSWRRTCVGFAVEHIHSIAVDPTDTRRVYAGTMGAGMYRSEDRGENWRFIGLPGAQVGRIVIEP
ncbi:MAG: hypothetical protein HY563_07160 [Ignavibacteriales bacterium]|nr:hypothetical protein [Ignavibacteriales bacterium]